MNDKLVLTIGTFDTAPSLQRLIEHLKDNEIQVSVLTQSNCEQEHANKEVMELFEEFANISKAQFIKLCTGFDFDPIEKLIQVERLELKQSKGPHKTDRDHWKARGRK